MSFYFLVLLPVYLGAIIMEPGRKLRERVAIAGAFLAGTWDGVATERQ